MNFNEYIKSLPDKPSKVKALILRTLWDSGTDFPRDWVKSSRLLELTQQKYFDRRTRELRDEMGCDIQTEHHFGEHCYRLKSTNLTNFNPRQYLTTSQKNELFNEYHHTCGICSKQFKPGVRGLQADHKVPLIRGGSQEKENWQPICNECNVVKRRACADCKEDCETCSWAFPKRAGLIVLIPQELRSELRGLGLITENQMAEFVVKTLKDKIKKPD